LEEKANVVLIDVYGAHGSVKNTVLQVLYEHLAKREPNTSISHTTMPTWDQHENFVRANPYARWFLIFDITAGGYRGLYPIGQVYLTRDDEIGLYMKAEYRKRGFATEAIKELMRFTKRPVYLANINPLNAPSIAFFEKLGFRHVQNTYRLDVAESGVNEQHMDEKVHLRIARFDDTPFE
jgi:RimJ/RimL family protein N-acetyltransferase